MAEFEQAGATERLRRIAILRDMQRRLRHSPAEALGVEPSASATEVRSAFMSLTKQYHPTKFARLDEATMKLANEVFLQLREAYETLRASAEPKKPELRQAKPADLPPRRLATNNEATAAAKPALASASGASAGRPPLNSTPASRPSASAMSGSSRRPPSPGGAAPSSTMSRPDAASSSAGRSAAGRPAGSASASISRSASASGRGAIPSTSSAAGSGRVLQPAGPANPTTPPASSGATSSEGPRVRFGAPARGEPAGKEISKEMSKVRDLIVRERWAEARDALQLLLVHRPSDRANLAQLAYVRGREALELGNVTEARRELVRALAIEPTMEPARAALQGISTPSQPQRR